MEKELAILFVDIVDSTRLFERLGNQEAYRVTREMLHQLRTLVEQSDGTVVQSLGDGLLCTFEDADNCCIAAVRMNDLWYDGDNQIRIGIHYGAIVEVEVDGEAEIAGDAVNTSARVESFASPGEILATADFVAKLSPSAGVLCRLLDHTTVKGKTVPIGIYRLTAEATSDDTYARTLTSSALEALVGAGDPYLEIRYLGQLLRIDRQQPKISIGRQESNALRIDSRHASRQHAAIEFMREGFVITDHSSNGTYVTTAGGHLTTLKRDRMRLIGDGLIGFGNYPSDETETHVISYAILA